MLNETMIRFSEPIPLILISLLTAGFVAVSQLPQTGAELEIQLVVTAATGAWFYCRKRYTDDRGITSPTAFDNIASYLILTLGTLCFAFVFFRPWWYLTHAAVLFAAIFVDWRIVREHTSAMMSARKGTVSRRWHGFIRVHHYYAMIRDASMGLWWLVAGFLAYRKGVPGNVVMWAFGPPYAALVSVWVALKVRTYEFESEYISLPDKATDGADH